jgi:hypothetical protein
MRQFLGQFREFPSLYTPRKLIPHAFPWFEQKVKESFLKYHTRIVFIDHLHYLIDLAKLRNPSIDIGNIIRKMKTLAVNDGLVIFLLCHTTKIKDEEDLSANSIRDSSFVGQESDTVFMIKRTPKDGETTARLRVEFHRRTGVLERVIRLRKVGGYLVEEADNRYEDDND